MTVKLNRNDVICPDCMGNLKGDDKGIQCTMTEELYPCQVCKKEGTWLPARKILWPQEIYDEMVKK